MTRHTITEQAAASPAFSASRPVFETSPRTSRENAFSSRSRASVPAASSSVMNMSETATASATANDVSEVGAAVERRGLHPDRLAHDREHVVREREVLAREAPERDDAVELERAPADPSAALRAWSEDSLRALEAQHVELLAEERVLPPC